MPYMDNSLEKYSANQMLLPWTMQVYPSDDLSIPSMPPLMHGHRASPCSTGLIIFGLPTPFFLFYSLLSPFPLIQGLMLLRKQFSCLSLLSVHFILYYLAISQKSSLTVTV